MLRHGDNVLTMARYISKQRIYYYREVENEPNIPFKENILFQDQHILVAYKPHFLPVTPGGAYVNECLQNRLRRSTGIDSLQALHRLDRATAGIVLFSVNPSNSYQYHHLFETRNIHKTYQAMASTTNGKNLIGKEWVIKNRIEKSIPGFCMRIADGKPNSHSVIRCIEHNNRKALFELNPVTGRTHQLRLHMQVLGCPILNDKFYPKLQPLSPDDYSAPLQLLSRELRFIDPVTQQPRHFSYDNSLLLILHNFSHTECTA